MANTFTQLYVQIVFSTIQRAVHIDPALKDELLKYISGIIRNKGNKLLAINSMPDHIHIFLGLKPDNSIAGLVREIKISSTNWINEKKDRGGKFCWQEGYGAFSYSHDAIDNVVKYILEQENHHKRTSFREEYIKLLNDFNIKYDEKYLPGSSE